MLIYLADLVHNRFPGNYVMPLNIGYVAAYAKQEFGDDVEIKLFKYPDNLLSALEERTPDVLGLSNYSWNFSLNKLVAKSAREKNANLVIVMGGPNIRIDEEGIKSFLWRHDCVDFYALGSGEIPFSNVIRRLLDGGGRGRLKAEPIIGCASLNKGDLVMGPPAEQKALEVIPSPYLTGLLDEFLPLDLIPIIETNRGCPFHCTFCVWGIAASKKVKVFPIERVFDEIDYIHDRLKRFPVLLVADATFGILPRDVQIAKRIKEASKRNEIAEQVQIWYSLGVSEAAANRGTEIASILRELSSALIAVQSFDPEVLENIKRKNISIPKLKSLMEFLRRGGNLVSTDILLGLSGESKASHLNTLRQAFTLGFDYIGAGNIRMLAGSEMETDASREKYQVKTRYRQIEGSYGYYGGEKAFELEESVRQTSIITEDEMFSLRMVHWLIWYCWNLGYEYPILQYIRTQGINPLDFILELVERINDQFPLVQQLYTDFEAESRGEWFDSVEEAEEYFSKDNNFDELLSAGFAKLNFKYSVLLLLRPELFQEFQSYVENTALRLLGDKADKKILREIASFSSERIYLVDLFAGRRNCISKMREYSLETLSFVSKHCVGKRFSQEQDMEFSKSSQYIKFYIERNRHESIITELHRLGFDTNRERACEKLFETYQGIFYTIAII